MNLRHIAAKRKNTNFTLFPFHIYVHESKIKQREERRWLRQNLLVTAIFLLTALLNKLNKFSLL